MQSYRLITVATLVDRLKINGSLARQALKDLEEKGQIKKVVGHSKLSIYSRFFIPAVFGVLGLAFCASWERFLGGAGVAGKKGGFSVE